MPELPSKAIDAFGSAGGLWGLVILLLIGFMIWYISTSRKHHTAKDILESKERVSKEEILATERKEWRATIDRNSDAFHELAQVLQTKPCARPTDARTRSSDHYK